MLFNTTEFFVFIIFFLLAYFKTQGNTRLFICLTFSYIFYAWYDWRFGPLIVFLTIINFFIGLKIANTSEKQKTIKFIWLGVLFNLGLLAIFKYFNFFSDSLHPVLGHIGLSTNITTLKIIAPLGISFYTFKIISYFVDIYQGNCQVEKSFLKFGVFYTFFPILLTGPLIAAADKASCIPFIVNGGTGIATCIRDVATTLCQAWGESPQIKFSGKQRSGDPFSLVADIQRLQTLGFVQQHKLAEGMEEYVRWFKYLQ